MYFLLITNFGLDFSSLSSSLKLKLGYLRSFFSFYTCIYHYKLLFLNCFCSTLSVLVCISIFIYFNIFFNFPLDFFFSFTLWLLIGVLFCFHIFVNYPAFLWLVSNFIPLGMKKKDTWYDFSPLTYAKACFVWLMHLRLSICISIISLYFSLQLWGNQVCNMSTHVFLLSPFSFYISDLIYFTKISYIEFL